VLNLTISDHDTVGEMLLSRDHRAWDDFEEVWLQGPYQHIISIVDSEEPDGSATPPPGGWDTWNALQMNKLRLEFDDIEQDNRYLGRWAPRRHHVQSIIEFARGGLTEGRVLIHCAAGISRSTAAGLVCLVAVGMNPEEAVAKLQTVKKEMCPNRSIVFLADDILHLEGTLVDAYNNVWQGCHGSQWPGEQF
jgi:predicted protein tyrosine phosphatase